MTATLRVPKMTDAPETADTLPTYDARDLVQTGSQARILLNGQIYYLRITRAGKLILTK